MIVLALLSRPQLKPAATIDRTMNSSFFMYSEAKAADATPPTRFALVRLKLFDRYRRRTPRCWPWGVGDETAENTFCILMEPWLEVTLYESTLICLALKNGKSPGESLSSCLRALGCGLVWRRALARSKVGGNCDSGSVTLNLIVSVFLLFVRSQGRKSKDCKDCRYRKRRPGLRRRFGDCEPSLQIDEIVAPKVWAGR